MVYSRHLHWPSFILLTFLPYIHTDISCAESRVYLTATTQSQVLVSSEYDDMQGDTTSCIWVIQSHNGSYVIEYQLLHWFAPASSECASDYVLLRDGVGSWLRPLRFLCKNSRTNDEIVKSRTSTLSVELVSAIYWDERVVFVLAYWTAPKDIEVVVPVEYGTTNYVLILLSIVIGAIMAAGVIVLLFKEYRRCRHNKNMRFRQKLNVRRKGISGQTVRRSLSVDTISESTSYIQLSETPTSGQCSSAWSVSPNRACTSATPTSGNASL